MAAQTLRGIDGSYDNIEELGCNAYVKILFNNIKVAVCTMASFILLSRVYFTFAIEVIVLHDINVFI